MYRNYYGFKKYPFCNTPDTEFFFESDHHVEALSNMVYVINERKGFAAITGEIGSGKTILSRKLINQLSENVEIGLIPNTCLRDEEFLKAICEEFKITISDSSEASLLSSINNFLLTSLAQDKNVVLIVDEAQNLSLSTLEKIRMLSNLETEKEKLIQILLLGQTELKDILKQPKAEQIRQRINVWFHLKPLSYSESVKYIKFRLNIAGNPLGEIFTEDSILVVFELSKGVPRIINTICDNALLVAYVRGTKKINSSIITEVGKDLGYIKSDVTTTNPEEEKPSIPSKNKSFYSSSLAIVLSSLIVVLGIVQLFNKESSSIYSKESIFSNNKINVEEVLEIPKQDNIKQPALLKTIPLVSTPNFVSTPINSDASVSKKVVKKRKNIKFVPTESNLE